MGKSRAQEFKHAHKASANQSHYTSASYPKRNLRVTSSAYTDEDTHNEVQREMQVSLSSDTALKKCGKSPDDKATAWSFRERSFIRQCINYKLPTVMTRPAVQHPISRHSLGCMHHISTVEDD